jgi:putative transcription factor
MCGQDIYSRPINIEIEGAILEVCPSCAKHGKRVEPSKSRRTSVSSQSSPQKRTTTPRYSTTKKPRFSDTDTGKELISDYNERIRLARQKMKLSQKDVSIQTKISIQELQSIETGKMRPPDNIINKLEKFFKIKITEDVTTYSPQESKKGPAFQTLGDVVVIKKKKEDQ